MSDGSALGFKDFVFGHSLISGAIQPVVEANRIIGKFLVFAFNIIN